MVTVPAREKDRVTSELKRFQKTLEQAKARDVNEADTVVIVRDLLGDLFGYDRYTEITSEFAIRGAFCDLAIKAGEKPHLLIEVKAIGLDLKANHLRQAIGYGATQGVEWAILTNGVVWEAYRILFQQPIETELVFRVDLLHSNPRDPAVIESLYVLCKEGIAKAALSEFHEAKRATSRYVLAALLLSEPVVSVLRRELRRIAPDVKIELDWLTEKLAAEVIKREALEGDQADAAKKLVKRGASKVRRRATEKPEPGSKTESPAAGDETGETT